MILQLQGNGITSLHLLVLDINVLSLRLVFYVIPLLSSTRTPAVVAELVLLREKKVIILDSLVSYLDYLESISFCSKDVPLVTFPEFQF